ncbi:MAG TPA: zf-TFIIB domain-containing protein [Candidatus Eisenbacteria bacterium]|nr:zf-TFIIB domain-containing protein [Candidatus Eisenbacteria bacterium]
MVSCPECGVAMKAVTVRANPGSLIELNQCANCGGIWCDKWELFPIQPDEAARLEPADATLLLKPSAPGKKQLYCPRCTARLAVPRDPLFPAELQLRRCLKCDGIWLNRGQFTGFKRRQRKVREDKLGYETLTARLPEVSQDPGAWVVTGTRGMFAYPAEASRGTDSIEDPGRGVFRVIVQALLRMALGI